MFIFFKLQNVYILPYISIAIKYLLCCVCRIVMHLSVGDVYIVPPPVVAIVYWYDQNKFCIS